MTALSVVLLLTAVTHFAALTVYEAVHLLYGGYEAEIQQWEGSASTLAILFMVTRYFLKD